MSIKDELANKIYAHIKPAIDDLTGETQRRHDRRIRRSVNFKVLGEIGKGPDDVVIAKSGARQITSGKPYTRADLPRIGAGAYIALDHDAIRLLQAENKRRSRNMRRAINAVIGAMKNAKR